MTQMLKMAACKTVPWSTDEVQMYQQHHPSVNNNSSLAPLRVCVCVCVVSVWVSERKRERAAE